MANDPITGGLTLAEKVFSFFTGQKFSETMKRKQLREKNEECRRALSDRRWDDLRRLTAELERMSDEA
jgi:hypothetical protein